MNLPGAATHGFLADSDPAQPPGLVVMGVDGSAASRCALLSPTPKPKAARPC